jgi:catechol 2,3-dioxygenase-like lactoylglutathione lyase family enzyme
VVARPARQISGLDHVQIPIPVGGEDAVRRFYGDLLGLTEVAKPAPLAVRGGCWLTGPGVALHFGAETPFQPWRKAHVALLVEDLDRLRAALDAAGVTTRDDPTPIGVRRFYADDPFGNRLELVDRRDGGFTERSPGGGVTVR